MKLHSLKIFLLQPLLSMVALLYILLGFYPQVTLASPTQFVLAPKKVKNHPRIDGRLDDHVWQDAPMITDYIQFEPHKGEPASVRTELRVVYDDTLLYFAFKCYDPEPDKIVLGTQCDGLKMGTDSDCVTLDSFNDKRNAYYFRTNPLGVQHDGRVSDNGRVADLNWDGQW